MSTKPSLTLQRRINAAPAKVFRAWTEAAQLMKWMHPGDAEVTRAELDARVDGRYSIRYLKADGRELEVSGQYLEVAPDAKLVFTWAWRSSPEQESLVTVLLRPEGNGTLLTLTHEQFVDEETRDHHQFGWNGGLDSLERYFA
ncbi:SRPBCC domain-containing protein [Paraburkholderia sediminicola]|uniref:SRPBCC domain-containing protein n=1 Tax=Paraburkholderia metrosideri TaxID=580937 RepID=A0ABW9E3A8_9BURK